MKTTTLHQWPISVLVLAASFSWESPTLGEDRPNILFIVSEDNGPELGCYGQPNVKTPVLDALAESGVRFDRAYVPQAGCSQSRAAFLTGLYPHQNGQIGLATWKFRMYREQTPNIVRSLKDAGYRTGIIGKLHVNPAEAFPFDFHEIKGANFNRKDLGAYAQYAEKFVSAGEEPFFLSVNYPDAHRPHIDRIADLPEELLTANDVEPLNYFGLDSVELRSQTASHLNCMSRLDTLIGDLIEALKRAGKFENTLIVYFGDHGADLLRGKRTSYEGGIRVPLIIAGAGVKKPGRISQHLVSTLDLFPTVLELTRAETVSGLPGESLLPILGGEDPNWRKYLFTEFHLHSAHNFYPQRTVRNERFKLIHNLQPDQVNPGYDFTLRKFFAGLPEVVDQASDPVRSAYHRMEKPPEFELYDLKNDPYEFENLAESPDYASHLQELRSALNSWRHNTSDPMLTPDNLARLRKEVEACLVDGDADKALLNLSYPEYFFDN